MKDRREINIEVFEDTMKHYKSCLLYTSDAADEL